MQNIFGLTKARSRAAAFVFHFCFACRVFADLAACKRVCESLDLASGVNNNPLWHDAGKLSGKGDYQAHALDRLVGDAHSTRVLSRQEQAEAACEAKAVELITPEETRKELAKVLDYIRRCLLLP